MPGPHPTNRPDGPTAKQLRYLRALANTRGQTFAYPRTQAEATREIKRLQAASEDNRLEREVERDRLQREVEIPADATQVREEEITGQRASARWTHTTPQRPATSAGAPHELGRYELPDGRTRAVVAQRINGRVAIIDTPISGDGRVYLVERHVASQAEMQALVAAYIEDSTQRGEPAVRIPADPERGR